jgi:hypothetical protein
MRALRVIPALILLACGVCRGEEQAQERGKLPGETPLTSPGKSFSIVRAHDEPTEDDPYRIAEKVVFAKAGLGEVPLEAIDWRGFYFISPDDRWILRTQKTGSGQSEAWLYRVEENGRVSQVQGFDARAWLASDAVSRLKFKELYHTGVHEVTWSKDSKTLILKIGGTNVAAAEGIETQVTYDIATNTFTAKPVPDEKDEKEGKN